MASPLGDIIRTQLSNIVNKFANSANKKLDAADAGDATAVLANGQLTITTNSTTDEFEYILHGVKGGKEVATVSGGLSVTDVASSIAYTDVTGTGYSRTVNVNYTPAAESTPANNNKLDLDAGSEYYVEIRNKGTQEVFYSNRVIVK